MSQSRQQKRQAKKKLPLSKAGTALAGWSGMQTMKPAEDCPTFFTYSSCDELPLYLFEKAYLRGEKKALIISGDPGEADLQKAWDIIYSDYLERMGDTQSIEMLYQLSLLQAVRSKIFRVKFFVAALSKMYRQEFVQILQEEGYAYEYKNDDTLDNDLKRTLTNLIQDELEEQDLSALVEEKQGNDKSEKINNNYFRESLAQCSAAFKYHIPYNKELMTADFCAYIKQLRQQIDQQQPVEEEYYG